VFENTSSEGLLRKTRLSGLLVVLMACFFLFASGTSAHAQKLEPKRPVLYKIGAKYPAMLRSNGIGGTVRLTVVIDARGNVEKVTPVGGNPALVDSAITAVKQWKYAPAETSTKMEVQFAFVPDQQ
jgi:TonB family protein